MTPRAVRHLQWIAQRTDCELSSTGILSGILSTEKKRLSVADVILVEQHVSVAYVDLDSGTMRDER